MSKAKRPRRCEQSSGGRPRSCSCSIINFTALAIFTLPSPLRHLLLTLRSVKPAIMVAMLAPKYAPRRSVVCAALSVLILFALYPSTEALRRFTPNDAKIATELKRKAASAENTSYGQPVAELTSKLTSVDHFGSVRYPVFCIS